MKKLREMKKNNKGFSLVELIVVIAIMVVLVAVLGSTILGYVDKSKHSKDFQALDSVKTALSTYVADAKCNYMSGKKYNLTELMSASTDPNRVIAKTLVEVFQITIPDSADANITAAAFNNASNAFAGITTNDVTVQITNGAVAIEVKSKVPGFDDYKVGTIKSGS